MYLGCRNLAKRRFKPDFVGLKDKTSQKLSGQKTRILSIASKVFLIKSSITDIAQYFMYWLKLPKYICNETDSLDMNFLWCKNKKEEKKFAKAIPTILWIEK